MPGHEITGIVATVGKHVTKFRVGDKAGVDCLVNSYMKCEGGKNGEERHCETTGMVGTCDTSEQSSPTEISRSKHL